MMRNKFTWVLLFSLTLILSLDYWAWAKPLKISFLGFPTWVFYFIFLQAIFAVILALFTKFYWRNEEK